MPAPIAISRTRSELDSFGAPRVGSLTVGSGPASSWRETMAMSLGKDVSDIMDYSLSKFSSSIDSDATAQPSTSLSRGGHIETTFCRNFTCCGLSLEDLHDLLQHYEECHVRFEDDDMPGMVADDGLSSASSSSQPPSPRAHNLNDESASPSDGGNLAAGPKGKKRSFGQFSSSAAGAAPASAIHQSLRRALIDGGVGAGTPSVYTASSPFSTPDSSIPGTPLVDSDAESAFLASKGVASSFSNLSLRAEESSLPSCAPPNLFFPSNSGSSSHGPPTKRERTSGATSGAGKSGSKASKGSITPNIGSSADFAAAALACDSDGSVCGDSGIDKPYKCTTPGCDKAYKQMNGLKYHRLHGSCNRNNVPVHEIVADATSSSPSTPFAPPTSPVTEKSNSIFSPALSSPGLQRSLGSPAPSSAPSSPRSSASSLADERRGGCSTDKVYVCQVGACGKRYRNLQGLRYHYLHSGSHGLLGQALLAANGGGPSARVDATTGRAPVNTQNMSASALASIAAQAHQQHLAQQQSRSTPQQPSLPAADADSTPMNTSAPDALRIDAPSNPPAKLPLLSTPN